MVTLEQIHQLDSRVHRAIELIAKLREENYTLKNKLAEYQDRIEELEVLISNFKEDQSEIERGIASVLSDLDHLDEAPAARAKEPKAEPRPQPERAKEQRTVPAAHAHPRPAATRPAPPSEPREQPAAPEIPEESDKPEAELDIF